MWELSDEQERRRRTEERTQRRSVSQSIISEERLSSHPVAADAETRARHEKEKNYKHLPLPDKEAGAHLPLCTATATHLACIAGVKLLR
jgi:hypothetical protein